MVSFHPQVFYSHAWKFLFLEVVEAAQRYFKASGDDPFIWFDVFSVSQHKSGVRPFEWWNGAFLNAVSTIGFVLMCMQPFEDPRTHTPPWTTLSRVWYAPIHSSHQHSNSTYFPWSSKDCVTRLLTEDNLGSCHGAGQE
jgi:hypothetical protein